VVELYEIYLVLNRPPCTQFVLQFT